jgi:hypothetical protein
MGSRIIPGFLQNTGSLIQNFLPYDQGLTVDVGSELDPRIGLGIVIGFLNGGKGTLLNGVFILGDINLQALDEVKKRY